MLPRVKLSLAIALGLFVISFTDVAVPAQSPSPSASKPGTFSPLIAFRPYSKVGSNNWLGASPAEAAEDLHVYVYDSGSTRYDVDVDQKRLTGKTGADGDGEKIVFDNKVNIEVVKGKPPSEASAERNWPLYLTIEHQKPCWHLIDESLSLESDTSIKHKALGRLIESSNLQECNA